MNVTGPLYEFDKTLEAEKQTILVMLDNAKTVRNALMSLQNEEEFCSIVTSQN